MFKLRRSAKTEARPSPPSRQGQTVDAPPITYEFVAKFEVSAANKLSANEESGVYTMCPHDQFAVLRDADAEQPNGGVDVVSSGALNRVPKVIAVILEPDGCSRFFHPEASRRAGRPIWQPLQPLES